MGYGFMALFYLKAGQQSLVIKDCAKFSRGILGSHSEFTKLQIIRRYPTDATDTTICNDLECEFAIGYASEIEIIKSEDDLQKAIMLQLI